MSHLNFTNARSRNPRDCRDTRGRAFDWGPGTVREFFPRDLGLPPGVAEAWSCEQACSKLGSNGGAGSEPESTKNASRLYQNIRKPSPYHGEGEAGVG
jgi:hypothetical protein